MRNYLFIFSLWHQEYKKRKSGFTPLKSSLEIYLKRQLNTAFCTRSYTSCVGFQLPGYSFQVITTSQNYSEKEEVSMFKKKKKHFAFHMSLQKMCDEHPDILNAVMTQ